MIRHLLIAAALGIGCAFPVHAAYWSLFNIEGESALTAQYVTYGSLTDMLGDTNRLGVFSPTSGGAGTNIVGSGSNGEAYWSLFNIEGESALTAQYVTYGSLTDMLGDTNRLGVFSPTAGGAGANIVGSGSNGEVYWSLFNIEGESALTAQYVTYGSLTDMLGDTNRLGVFSPTAGGASVNIVGSGSDLVGTTAPVPAPETLALLGIGLGGLGMARRRMRRTELVMDDLMKQESRPRSRPIGSPDSRRRSRRCAAAAR